MNLIKRYSVLLIILTMSALFSSCEKDGVNTPTLLGTWKLTESYADPGDGSGKYVKVPKDSQKLLVIGEDGTITGDALPVSSYKVLSDPDRLQVLVKGQTNPIIFFYKLSGNTLNLTGGGCIEGCGSKFERVK
ncbi:MAG: hypothetical protein EOO88_11395 [Pedobacter sp.]|nr:MAG: hypothetical protein EOO88_11395 [Pedobacter sp.]